MTAERISISIDTDTARAFATEHSTEALSTIRALVVLQLQNTTFQRLAATDAPFGRASLNHVPGYGSKAKPEGHAHTILADAVNQTLIQLESVVRSIDAYSVKPPEHAARIIARLHQIRETLSPIIPG